MYHYLDIHLRPDPEFPAYQLMAALFTKLHRALAQAQANTIGVSFPGYDLSPATLGNTLRLFGPGPDLARLMEQPWLNGMLDHTSLDAIELVPTSATHRRLIRVQVKSNPERLMRRQMRRHSLSEAEVRATYQDTRAQRVALPFVSLASSSTKQSFKLFLKLNPVEESQQVGNFNSYGLSQTATIPWF